MNNLTKVSISILGGLNQVFTIFMPVAVALLLVTSGAASVGKLNTIIILIIALGASMFRGIKPWLE